LHWVEGRGRKHLRRAICEVHRVHRSAIELVQVEARDVVVRIDELLVFLWEYFVSMWFTVSALKC